MNNSSLNQLNITKHPIDRTALIAGIMFSFAGLAYLVDDHGILNVTEGAVAGTVVIVIGLVLLLAAVIDSPEAPPLLAETSPPPAVSNDADHGFDTFDEAE